MAPPPRGCDGTNCKGTPLRTACTACHGVTLWSVWSAPPLPARASLPREGRSPCAHRVHRIPPAMSHVPSLGKLLPTEHSQFLAHPNEWVAWVYEKSPSGVG